MIQLFNEDKLIINQAKPNSSLKGMALKKKFCFLNTCLVGSLFVLNLIPLPALAHNLESSSVRCRSVLRLLLGREKTTLYRIKLDVPPTHIFSDSIPMVKSQGFVENLKSVARNKPVASFLLKELKGNPIENKTIDRASFGKILEENIPYAFIMTEEGIDLIKISHTPVGFFMTKHNVLSQLDPVLFAGELWVDKAGVLHVSNSSGSYQPKKELLPKIEDIFRKNFDMKIILESHGETK